MKRLLLIIVAVIMLSAFGLKMKFDRHQDTHIQSETVVYYAPGDVVMHTDAHCNALHLNGQKLQQSTYGKMQFSHYVDQLCTRCVPQEYRN